jgi:putative transposase
MRDLLTTFINALLSAQADAVCGAEYGTRSRTGPTGATGTGTGTWTPAPARSMSRSPSCVKGHVLPGVAAGAAPRAEAALTTVVATCYLLGVSTRRMDKLVQTLGITGLSKSQVSEMAKDLDEQVESFRTRPSTRARTRSSRRTRW